MNHWQNYGNIILLLFFIFISNNQANAQEQRISDNNSIGWIGTFGNVKINKLFSLHAEYQWRRTNVIKNQQQHLVRTGLQYKISNDVTILAGYAYVYSSPYGDYPAPLPFPEHRSFQQAIIKSKIGKATLINRFRLEQRWVGQKEITEPQKISKWIYTNRARYFFRCTMPIINNAENLNILYTGIQNEIFIGFGKNVGVNIFDQNRLGIIIGHTIDKNISIEGGYLYQILQQRKLINNQSVFQYNKGIQLSILIST